MAFEWFDFKPITDTVSGAFGWLKDNPEVASAIGGAAGAGIQYLQGREALDARKKEIAEQRAYRSQFGGPSTLGDQYSQNLNIASSGIATDTGTVGPTSVGQVGAPNMASALELRAQRQRY